MTAPSLVELIRSGTLDARLAALVWRLVEGGIPLVVTSPPDRLSAAGQLLEGCLQSIRPEVVTADLVSPPDRDAIRAVLAGERPGAVVRGGSLEAVLARLAEPWFGLGPDELTFLGCALVLGPREGAAAAGPLRVVAAHYVRPLARDAAGHAQRLPPAVLATWDERLAGYEHFDWGVLPEIAARIGLPALDLDRDVHHREDDLAGLAAAGVTGMPEVQRLLAGYRVAVSHPTTGTTH